MPDTTEKTAEQPGDAALAEAAPQPVYCRWCGAGVDAWTAEPADWLCGSCDRWQDATTCPTCGGNARLSVLPADMQPKPAKPKKE